MRANELRIGSWVYSKESAVNYQIENGWEIDEGNELFPILLTEEWLLKFHNEEEIRKNVKFPNEITIYDRFRFIWKKEYKYWYVISSYHKEYLTKIEFVHEYQNFILALTGKELKIK